MEKRKIIMALIGLLGISGLVFLGAGHLKKGKVNKFDKGVNSGEEVLTEAEAEAKAEKEAEIFNNTPQIKSIYEIYESKYENVKNIYKEKNIPIEEYDIEGNKGFSYMDENKTNEGDIIYAEYGIANSIDGKVECISLVTSILTSKESFKIEDTVLYDLTKAMVGDKIDYSYINSEVNRAIEANSNSYIYNYANTEIEFFVGDEGRIYYEIRIKP